MTLIQNYYLIYLYRIFQETLKSNCSMFYYYSIIKGRFFTTNELQPTKEN